MKTYRLPLSIIFFVGLIVLGYARHTSAQDRFELMVPNSRTVSTAVRTEQSLQVVGSDGRVTDYRREPRYDSAVGDWLGYYSRAANQIVRWPASNSGNMQIGSVRGNAIEYRPSQMQIQVIGGQPTPVSPRKSQRPDIVTPVLPPEMNAGTLPQPAGVATDNLFDSLRRSDLFGAVASGGANRDASAAWLRLASFDQSGSPWLLSHSASGELSCVAAGTSGLLNAGDWWASPTEGGYTRIQTYTGGRVFAVSATRSNGLALQPLSQDARQLWRVVGGRGADRFALVNAFNSGQCLTHAGRGRLVLQPMSFAPTQLWVPYAAPVVATVQPFWRSVSREIHANAQLPPAQLELQNSQRSALIVLLGDVRQGASVETIRIESGSTKTITLDRDAGSTIVETIEIRSPAGIWDRQELVTAIPPAALYDLSVYEEHLQSIAIDRTGKSPNPIEDVNYVPKSIGWMPLPAGAELPAYGQLDVYSRAKSSNNPGAVRRMDAKQFDDPAEERPLESILNKIQSTPRKSF